jgi:hypothetical protein
MRFARQWWPLPGLILVVVAVQSLVWRPGHASGHAAGHQASASAVFALLAVLSLIVWSAPAVVRRRIELWVLGSAVLGASLLSTSANMRIVDAIGANDWSDVEAGSLGPARPGFRSGHELAERAMWLVVGAAVLLIVWLRLRRAVSTRVAIGAVAANVLVPPWMFAGFGLVVVAVASVIARAGRLGLASVAATDVREPVAGRADPCEIGDG